MVLIHPGLGAGVCISLFFLQLWTERGCHCFSWHPISLAAQHENSAFLGSRASGLRADVCRYQEGHFLNAQGAEDVLSCFFGSSPLFFEGSRVASTGRRTLRFRIIWCYWASAFMNVTVSFLGCVVLLMDLGSLCMWSRRRYLMRYLWDFLLPLQPGALMGPLHTWSLPEPLG